MKSERQQRTQENLQKAHTILVIEDNQDMLQLIGRILLSQGYRVILAVDSTYGIDLVKIAKPDLVLLDIMMPDPDGYTILKSIRQHSNVPVIMVTARWEKEAVQKALALDADSYLKKPFSPTELLILVKARLQHN